VTREASKDRTRPRTDTGVETPAAESAAVAAPTPDTTTVVPEPTVTAAVAPDAAAHPHVVVEQQTSTERLVVPLGAITAPPLPTAPATGGVRSWLSRIRLGRFTEAMSSISAATVREVIAEAPLPAGRPPVVEFRNVSKVYDDGFLAVKDITFRIDDLPAKGEFVTILGPSGCGKSTILRLIAGLTPQFPASSGDVLIFGKPVSGPGADRGMVFQDYTSFDNRTVLDNVVFGLECQGMPKKQREELAREAIAKVGLDVTRDSDKYPHQLSGGMRQRVAFARTLILKPKIMLMDEPFGALDPSTRYNMQDLLVQLWRELEATVFFITHSIEEAVYLGDRTFIMSPAPGRILQELEVPPPDRPAKDMQREPAFMEVVYAIRDTIATLEMSTKAGT
jgi:ABC-type nitrate/sulfonate/bicarbonate transport system ATPase subunit